MSSLKNKCAAAFVCAVRLNSDGEWQEQSQHCDLIFSKKCLQRGRDSKDFRQDALNGWLRVSTTNMLITFRHTVLHLLHNESLFPGEGQWAFVFCIYLFIFGEGLVCAQANQSAAASVLDCLTHVQNDTVWTHCGKLETRFFKGEACALSPQCFMEWKMAACWTFIHNRWCPNDLYKKTLSANRRPTFQHLTFNPCVIGLHLPKPSVAMTIVSVIQFPYQTPGEWINAVSVWLCARPSPVCRLLPRGNLEQECSPPLYAPHRSSCA